MANPNIVNVTDIRGESVGWNLTATTTTTLMTVSADKLIKINRITVANVDGTNAADLTLFIDTSVQTSSGATITIPNLVFSQGDVVTILNAHTSASTITCSTAYSFITGDTTNKPSVTLDARGICTLLFTASNIVYMSGNIS